MAKYYRHTGGARLTWHILGTGFLVLAMSLILISFYAPTNREFFGTQSITFSFIMSILLISIITDGVFLLLHLPLKPVEHRNAFYEPEKLTVLIACYNGESVIGETIENALKKVPASQIIVASDASKDNTVAVAKSYGVVVLEYKENVNKAFTINRAIHEVTTPYVLILDDDTLIGNTFIPTSLLEEEYDAVAFNMLPVATNSLVNKYQMFEYRKSMIIGKSLRGAVGGVGNVSGGIGLFRTEDLVKQDGLHSGQYGGEDQQRTMLVHLNKKNKGITYYNSSVYTKVPDSLSKLTKQRSKSWNLSCQELFWVYWRVLFSPKAPFLLKIDRAYQLYIVLTDPIRMFLILFVVFHPITLVISYIFYVFLGLLAWAKMGFKDPIWVVLTFPFYSKHLCFCRFYAYFHWYRVKFNYLKKGLHKKAALRNLALEYTLTLLVFFSLWVVTVVVVIKNIPDVNIVKNNIREVYAFHKK